MRLNQKTAIVTGAGSGMGQAEAIGFAKEGAQVVVADVNLATAEATRDAIVAAGGKAIALAVDVTQLADLQHLVDVTLATYGRIDVLVNNAGIFDYYTASLDTSGLRSSNGRPSSTILILSSAEKCRRVLRRMSFTTCSAGALDRDFALEDLGFIFVPSSLRRSPNPP